MKIVQGEFYCGETVFIELDGKIITRKVHYGILDGLYVIIDGEKIGYRALTYNTEPK